MPNGKQAGLTSEKYAHLRLKTKPDQQKKSLDLSAAYEVLLTAYERKQLQDKEGK